MSKSKDENAVQAVKDYLTKQNRPYSAIDVFTNLHKAFGKTAVVKALESLAEKGQIRSKVYGKQTVFVADQSKLPEVSEEELKTLDSTIAKTQSKLKEEEDRFKKLDSELRSLTSALSTKEAQERLQLLTEQCEKFKTKLNNLKTNPNAVSPEERTKTNDILNAVLEGYPKSKRELYEEIGIETDEDYNVKPPEV